VLWRVTQGAAALNALVLAGGITAACQRPVRSTQAGKPTAAQMAELWIEPAPQRDLFWGVGGRRLAPDPSATYTVVSVKQTGFSRGYDVKAPDGREWSVKFPPEAPTEVVASRILWAIGYHQPPLYYLPRWTAANARLANPQEAARFRESKPDLHGLDDKGNWSYYENPFVGTVQLNGLIVLQVMLGNSDLKDENNRLYELRRPYERARRWYVARDLGQTFGRTGVLDAPRGDIEIFESTPFITGVENGRVRFDWRGRHDVLVASIRPADVRWVCARLQRLSDAQWDAAFRAGGFPKPIADRFIRRLQQKIRDGLAVKG
jgi:hypothetical protein